MSKTKKPDVLKQSLYMDHPIGKAERQKRHVCYTVKELREALATYMLRLSASAINCPPSRRRSEDDVAPPNN